MVRHLSRCDGEAHSSFLMAGKSYSGNNISCRFRPLDIRYFSFVRLEVSAVIPFILYRKHSEYKQYQLLCCKYLGVVSNIKKQVWIC